jgi:CRISPR system Cascade subunit CasA
MNLTTDPWIPVITVEGASSEVSLLGLFSDCGNIADLCVHPPDRISVLNLLIAIAQAALHGPKDEASHMDCRTGFANAAAEYLRRPEISRAFELLGPHPRFLQIHGEGKPGSMSLAKLGGVDESGSTLFQPSLCDGAFFRAAWVALKLLSYQNYSPGGKVGGSAEIGGKLAPVSGKAGPRRDANAVHGYFRGANLAETIWLNMVPESELPSNMPIGKPVWEVFATLATPQFAKLPDQVSMSRSFLGRLVPLSRAIWIGGDLTDAEVTVAIDYPGFAEGAHDGSITTLRRKDKGKDVEVVLSCARGGRMVDVWRELPSVIQIARMDKAGETLAPLTFRGIGRLDGLEHVDIWLGGVGGDQANSVDYFESNYRLPTSALVNQDANIAWRKTFEQGIAFADKVNSRLYGMLATWLQNAKPNLIASNKKEFNKHLGSLKSIADLAYWSILQVDHGILVEAANRAAIESDDEDAVENRWEATVIKALHQAFVQACPGQTRLQSRARAMAVSGRRAQIN